MIQDEQTKKVYYKMLIEKNSHYEGIFYVGVKTTGVFCRPTCPRVNQRKKTVSFLIQPKKQRLLLIGRVNDVSRLIHQVVYHLK